MPEPTDIVSALSPVVPFVGPETLERRFGRAFHLRLGANESLFGPSPLALESMQSAAAGGYLYNDPEAWELRSEIAVQHSVGPENVALGAGIDDLLGVLARAFVAPGDLVATSLGGYPTFDYVVAGCGGRSERVPYVDAGSAVRVDLDGLAHAGNQAGAKLIYLANPDNPSGSFYGAEAIANFRAALPADSLLILDEAYADFVPLTNLPPIVPDDPQVVRLRTFSKAHGMAGLRIGYAIAHESHIATLNKIRLHFAVNSVAQAGALASMRDEKWLTSVVERTGRGRKRLVQGAATLGIPSLESHTNFVCLDFETRERAETILNRLLENQVFVRKPGASPLDRCVRVTLADEATMDEFLQILSGLIS